MSDAKMIAIISKIASEIFCVPVAEIDKDTQQGDLENWDSLGHLNLILAIEEELEVKFLSIDILNMKSIKEIAEKIQ